MKKRVITEQHFLNKYKNNNPELTVKERFKKACTDFAISFKPDFFAVYRPKKTKLSPKTIDDFMQRTVARFELLGFKGTIESIYYTLEEDRWEKSGWHLNMLIKGDGVNKLNLATAMKRSEQEIGYLEPIKSEIGVAKYVNKHIAKDKRSLAVQGIVEKEQAIKIADEQNDLAYKVLDTDPNKEYHKRAQFIMKYKYGWSKYPSVIV